jgi:hypothetical protein
MHDKHGRIATAHQQQPSTEKERNTRDIDRKIGNSCKELLRFIIGMIEDHIRNPTFCMKGLGFP